MKVYFVRHGSTDLLEKKISQSNEEPLNQRGLRQAEELAKRFSGTKLDLILSSPYARALQTAQIISPKVEASKLFAEVRQPKEVVGKHKEDQEVLSIIKKLHEMYLINPSWHFSDEENFEDLKKRGVKALSYIASRKADEVLIVSHGNFIAIMFGLMLLKDAFTAEIFLSFKKFLRLSNTGISIFTYEEGSWKMHSWNDTSHCLE